MKNQMRFLLNLKSIIPLLVGLIFFCSIDVTAQQNAVSGVVVDSKGETIIGVNVIVKGTDLGAITDMDGSFSLPAVEAGSTLVFSFIGFTNQEIVFSGQLSIEVVMVEDFEILDEIVIIGYGSIKKDDLTGSVSVVRPDLDGRGMAPNPQDVLVGKIPGVQVVSSGGSPSGGATIRIRGGSSLSANNDPLIDGVLLHPQMFHMV